MARCGHNFECDCVLTAGPGVIVTGDGSAGTPFVVSEDVAQPQLQRLLPTPDGLIYSEISPGALPVTTTYSTVQTVTVNTPGAGNYTVKAKFIASGVDDSLITFDPFAFLECRLLINGAIQPSSEVAGFTQALGNNRARIQNHWLVVGAAMGASFDVEAQLRLALAPGATCNVEDLLMIVETRTG